MPLRPLSRGLSRYRREPVRGAAKKMGLPWDAYYVLTKAEARLTNSKIHPNTGAPDYDITHNVSDLFADADLHLGEHILSADEISSNTYNFSEDDGMEFTIADHTLTFTQDGETPLLIDPAGVTIAGNITDGVNTLTVAEAKTAFDHSQDNTQAHTDYLLNNANDSTSGTLTAAGFATAGTSTALGFISTAVSGDALYNDAGNADVNIWRIDNSGAFGFYQKYVGTGSGNDNFLELWTQGEAAEDDQVYRIWQDANIAFPQCVRIGSLVAPTAPLDVTGLTKTTSLQIGASAADLLYISEGELTISADTSLVFFVDEDMVSYVGDDWKLFPSGQTTNPLTIYYSPGTDKIFLWASSSHLELISGTNQNIILNPGGTGVVKIPSIAYIGDGGTTDYAEFGPDGDLTFVGDAGLSFGDIYGLDETITCTDEDTWYQVTFDTAGPSNSTTVTVANDDITIIAAGAYKIGLTVCCHSAVAHDFEVMVKKNNGTVDVVCMHLFQSTSVAGQVENISGSCIASLAATDTIEAWVQCTDAAGQDFIIDHCNLNVIQVGGT